MSAPPWSLDTCYGLEYYIKKSIKVNGIKCKYMILGVDEVGRGPWAGPLVVGAVVLGGAEISGLTDSKKLTKKRREALEPLIKNQATAWALGWVTALELDAIGMSEALRLATRRAVRQIAVPYSEIIIDGTINFLSDTGKGKYATCLPKGDLLVPSISAASVLAKVARDNYMAEQDEVYPGYNFKSHAGYGVKAHRDAIEKLGVCELHRLSFAPLQHYRDSSLASSPQITSDSRCIKSPSQTTRQIGNSSEMVVANELTRLGHIIRERNWRTKWCEVDIISQKDDTLFFTEVKHRKNDKGGDGFAAITSKKLEQMKFAAMLYATKHTGFNLRLIAASTAGSPPVLKEVLFLD